MKVQRWVCTLTVNCNSSFGPHMGNLCRTAFPFIFLILLPAFSQQFSVLKTNKPKNEYQKVISVPTLKLMHKAKH